MAGIHLAASHLRCRFVFAREFGERIIYVAIKTPKKQTKIGTMFMGISISKRLLIVSLILTTTSIEGLFFVAPPVAKAGSIYNIPTTITSDCTVDVTSAVQAWIDSVPDNSTLLFGKDACYDVDGGLSINDRNNIVLDGNGATFKLFSQSTRDRANWTIRSGSNITFQNMTAQGVNPGEVYDSTKEGQHGYRFEGTQTATLNNVKALDVYGDFVGTEPDWRNGGGVNGPPVRNLTVSNSYFDTNGRMGISLTHVDGFVLQDSYLGHVRWSAIDIELDASVEYGRNILIQRNHFGPLTHHMVANAGAGSTPNVENITIKDNVMDKELPTCLPALALGEAGYERDNWTIENNILRTAYGAPAIVLKQIGNATIDTNTIYTGVAGGCAANEPIQLNSSHDITMSNNQIYGSYTQVDSADSASTNVVSTNNVISPRNAANPLLTLTTPLANANLTGNVNLTTALTPDADTLPLNVVKYFLDYNTIIGTSSTGPSFPAVWDSSTATNGRHTISVNYYYSDYGFVHSPGVTVSISNTSTNPSDTTAPTISITAPSPNAILTGTAVPLSVNTTDNIGVVGVQYKVDGNNLGTEVTTAQFTKSLDTTALSNGTHSITAVARDAAGNTKTSAVVTVDVENVQTPVTPPVTPPANTGGGGGGGVISTPSPTDPGSSPGNLGNSGSSSVPSTPPPGLSNIKNKLVNDSGTYYLILDNVKRGVTNPGMLASYGYEFKDAQTIEPAEKSLPDGGPLLPGNGALVKSPEDKTVYLISNGEKHGFTSEQVFLGQGFKFSSVLTVTAPELDKLSLGSIISDPKAAHLQGTNISYQGTVYWVGGVFRHPYSSITIYNEWNKDNDFSAVVPANQADLQRQAGDAVVERVQG